LPGREVIEQGVPLPRAMFKRQSPAQ
jgi:hypothetical protein